MNITLSPRSTMSLGPVERADHPSRQVMNRAADLLDSLAAAGVPKANVDRLRDAILEVTRGL